MRSAVVIVLLLWLSSAAKADGPTGSKAGVDFFESRIRPILVDNCLSCHGPKKQEAGLRLDSRAALLRGADSGPVIEPGKPEESP